MWVAKARTYAYAYARTGTYAGTGRWNMDLRKWAYGKHWEVLR
jgi:hypothetical protein